MDHSIDADRPTSDIPHRHLRKPWYYTHVETALTKGGFDEFIPVRHYHHRCVMDCSPINGA